MGNDSVECHFDYALPLSLSLRAKVIPHGSAPNWKTKTNRIGKHVPDLERVCVLGFVCLFAFIEPKPFTFFVRNCLWFQPYQMEYISVELFHAHTQLVRLMLLWLF